MLQVEVKFDEAGARAMLERIRGKVSRRKELHQAMATGLEDEVRSYLGALGKTRSPNTGYFGKASRTVESTADGDRGTVRIPHRGMALRYYGGRVTMKDRYLTLPTKHVPIRGNERLRAGEMKDLAYLPPGKKAAAGTAGYLVEGMPKTGPNGKTRIVPKPDGKLMFVLREFTDHQKDETVIPPHQKMLLAATAAGEDYLAAAIQEGGRA